MSCVFLFGAGASAFSGECTPSCPPLGAQLFRALASRGGVASKVSPALAALFDGDFEAGMSEFRRHHEVETTAFLRDMAEYLAQFSPGKENLYIRLLRGLRRSPRPSVLATLNYDLLIELAVNAIGRKVAYHGLPAPRDNFAVLKLHGSCNFLPDLGRSSISGIGFDLSLAPEASILDAPVRPATVRQVLKFCQEEDAIAPALALYAKGKQVLYCPAFVAEQQTAWRREVAHASQIFVVGVRVVAEDEHVWSPLAKSRGVLSYVGPDAAPFLAWAEVNRRKNVLHLASTFADAIPEMQRRVTRV